MGKRRKINERAQTLINATSIHGIGKIFNSLNLMSRLFWAFFVISSWVYCSYVITISIFNFLEYKTITNIDVVYEQRPEFPRITICGFQTATWECTFNDIKCPVNSSRETSFFYGKNCTAFNSGKLFYFYSNLSATIFFHH